VRLPAGQCNLIGLKPTHRLIPHKERSEISEIGILSRTVMDCALLLEALASYESDDPRFEDGQTPRYGQQVGGGFDPQSVSIAVPWTYIRSIPLEQEVEDLFEEALRVLTKTGFTVSDVEIPELEVYRNANFIVLAVESYAKHAQNLKKNWSRYPESTRLNAVKGSFLSAFDYIQALEVARAARKRISGILKQHSLIALPTSPVVTSEAARQDPRMHSVGLNATYTAPFNLSGHPAVSLPCGMSSVGLPMGFQLVADFYQEGFLLGAARIYEDSTRWHTMHPPEFS
jgi:Asp-tRNA(Asn)/Glu-tRNA(Gln) amidotransferase A subunit family amidase